MKFLKSWLCAPSLWFAGVAALFVTWAVMDPAALVNAFDQDGYSPFELATLPFFAAIVPLVWWKCPFTGSKRRRAILCLAVSLVALMAIVKEMDLHNMALHVLYPNLVGEDGGIVPGVLFKPNGQPLTGTPFKARFLTNGAVSLGAKAFVVLYFTAFFGVFAAGMLYFAVPFLKGVFSLNPVAWSFGCFGASGVLVQVADRLPSWLDHAYGLEKSADGVTAAQSLCTALEEGGEMMIAVFALLAIYQSWLIHNCSRGDERGESAANPLKAALLAVAVLAAAFVCNGAGAVSKFDVALESAVAKGHPRLFADETEFVHLKADVEKDQGSLRHLAAQRVRERAELLLPKRPLERKLIGRRLLDVSRTALYRISTLSMAYRLSGERKFLERAVEEIKAVIAFSDWNPSHFLDTGEMSLAVSIGYDWLYADLPEALRAEIREALVRKSLDAVEDGVWWTKTNNNWGQVCRAGLIAASLSAADDGAFFDTCSKMLGESVAALPIAMKILAPDGCYPEGVGYWHYGISFNVFAIAMLESACGTDFGLSSIPGFMETAGYPNAVTGPLGLSIGYSDCGSSCGSLQVLWWFAKKLSRPDLITEMEISPFKSAPGAWEGGLPPLELFWMDGREPGTVASKTQPVVYLRGTVPLVVLRALSGKESAFAGLKGGSPRTNHGHMDGGNFVLDMGGVRWAWELPHEEYTRIEQMETVSLWDMSQESSRWSLLRLNALGHNVPVVDGAQQAVGGFARVVRTGETPDPSAEMDLTSLYPAAKKATRSYFLAKDGKSFVVCDVFEGLKPGAEIRWKFVTRAKAESSAGVLRLSESGRDMEVTREGTGATDWDVAPAEGEKPLNSPNPGFSLAGFSTTADADGRATAKVLFRLVK